MDKNKQLIHIKLLFLRAENIAKKTDDISLIMLAQLLDYTVETFLKTVISIFPTPQQYLPPQNGYHDKISKLESERYNPRLTFPRAWDEVTGILRDPQNNLSIADLPLRRDIDRLHEIRNDVQHKGTLPHPKDMQKFIPLVESFLIDVYQHIFNLDFENLNALSLIQNATIKKYLEQANEDILNSKWTDAVCNATVGFHILLKIVRKKAYARDVQDRTPIHDRYYDGIKLDFTSERQAQLTHNLDREVNRLKDHIAVVGFGVNYLAYIEVEPFLPEVHPFYTDADGIFHDEPKAKLNWKYSNELNKHVRQEFTEEQAIKVVRFVETQALEFQL